MTYQLDTAGPEDQTAVRDEDGCLLIKTASEGGWRVALKVPRTQPPFRFDAPHDAEQEAFARRVLVALQLLPFVFWDEDAHLTPADIAANVAERTHRHQTSGAGDWQKPFEPMPAMRDRSAEAQVAEAELCEEEACE